MVRGTLGDGRHCALTTSQDEEAVLGDQAGIDDLAFEIGVALLDQRSIDLGALHGGQLELRKLVDSAPEQLPMPTTAGKVKGRNVDHAFLAADHARSCGSAPDVAAYQRWLELHDHVPAHGHDVGLAPPGRAHQHDRAWFEKPANIDHGEVFLRVARHVWPLSHVGQDKRE